MVEYYILDFNCNSDTAYVFRNVNLMKLKDRNNCIDSNEIFARDQVLIDLPPWLSGLTLSLNRSAVSLAGCCRRVESGFCML